jgi:ADP-heptose:LPS heptosyltransferase
MAQRVLALGQRSIAGAPELLDGGVARWPMRLRPTPAAEARVDGFLREHAIGRFAAVNVSAAEWFRDWPPDRCTAALRIVRARMPGLAIVLTAAPGKLTAAEAVARELDARDVVVWPPSGELLDLAALLGRAAVVVTPDTAPLHIASAMGRPVVALYTPLGTPPSLWAPLGVPSRSLIAPSGEPVGGIAPEPIASAVEDVLREG